LRREKGGPPPSIFEKYITELPELNREESLLREKRIVECKLCRETGTESRITRRNLSRHMKSFHFPDEECTMKRRTGAPPSIFEKYITELPELNREESLLREKRIVECKLCRKKGTETRIIRRNLSRHISRFHLPDEECKVCGQIVKPVEMPRHRKRCGSSVERRVRATRQCPHCEKQMSKNHFKRSLERHLRSSCPGRPVM